MLTCPFWIASIKGVTPQLSLLSGLYWHLREKAKARTELAAGAKFSPSQLLCTGGAADHQWINEKIYRACLHTMQTNLRCRPARDFRVRDVVLSQCSSFRLYRYFHFPCSSKR